MQMLEGLPRLLLPRQKPATHLRRAPQVAPPADRLQGLTLVVQLKVGAQQQGEVETRKGDAVVRPGGGGGTVLGGVGSQEVGEVAHARDACNRRCQGCRLQDAGCRLRRMGLLMVRACAAQVGGRVFLLEAKLNPLPA